MKKETTGSSKKSNKLEKVIIPLLIVLVSLLSYSVGVLNGKKLSDREYSMKATENGSAHAANDEHAQEGDELSDEDINQIASAAIEGADKNSGAHGDAAVHDEEANEKSNSAMAEKHVDTPATEPAGAEHGANPVIAKGGTAVPSTLAKHDKTSSEHASSAAKISEEERSPSSIHKKPMSMLEYTVQVASYPEFKDAEKMAVDLHKKGYPAFVFKAQIKGQTWHRVSIGGYRTKKEAMNMQGEMVKQGIVKDAVVQKIKR
jgi:cell division septation protein DedD